MFYTLLIFITIITLPCLFIGLALGFNTTDKKCELNHASYCSFNWTIYENKQLLGGLSQGKLDTCECQQRCVGDSKCVGLDVDEKDLCWLHTTHPTSLEDNSMVNHYFLERICWDLTTSASEDNWETKFEKTENLMNIMNLNNNSTANASHFINILSSINEVIVSIETSLISIESSLDSSTKQIFLNKTQNLVEHCSKMLDRDATSWNQLSRDEKSQITGKLFHSVDKCAGLLSRCKPEEDKNFVIDTGNIIIEIISSLEKEDFLETRSTSNDKPNVRISSNNLGNSSKLILISYSNVDILSHDTIDTPNERDSAEVDRCGKESGSNFKSNLNSNVMSATILDRTSKPRALLVDPINITFQHLKTNNGMQPICVFWNYSSENGEGWWSSQGCRVTSSINSQTVCTCDHLTNFAILMSFTDHVLSEDTEYRLSMMTYIGCVISLMCLLLAFITFSVFRSLQCDRNSIHKNLVATLFVSELIFFLGINQICQPILCTLVAILMHYFFLSAFMWMCMEGFQLYVLLIHVFNAEKNRMKIYYPFAYGIPAIIVGFCLFIGLDGYGTKKYCWLSKEKGFIWAFVGPVIAILIINLHMLIITIVTMCRLSSTGPVQQIERDKKIKKILLWIKSALILMVLLGSTWIVGLFYVDQSTVSMAYLFIILNSLQGCFIFICHCLMNKKVRNEYRKCWSRFPCNRSKQVDFWKYSNDANKPNRRGTDASFQTYARSTDTAVAASPYKGAESSLLPKINY